MRLGVIVLLGTAVLLGVLVRVPVRVLLGVAVLVAVRLGVIVLLGVAVRLGVAVAVAVRLGVAVAEGVAVRVLVAVFDGVDVRVLVAVFVGVAVADGVCVRVDGGAGGVFPGYAAFTLGSLTYSGVGVGYANCFFMTCSLIKRGGQGLTVCLPPLLVVTLLRPFRHFAVHPSRVDATVLP